MPPRRRRTEDVNVHAEIAELRQIVAGLLVRMPTSPRRKERKYYVFHENESQREEDDSKRPSSGFENPYFEQNTLSVESFGVLDLDERLNADECDSKSSLDAFFKLKDIPDHKVYECPNRSAEIHLTEREYEVEEDDLPHYDEENNALDEEYSQPDFDAEILIIKRMMGVQEDEEHKDFEDGEYRQPDFDTESLIGEKGMLVQKDEDFKYEEMVYTSVAVGTNDGKLDLIPNDVSKLLDDFKGLALEKLPFELPPPPKIHHQIDFVTSVKHGLYDLVMPFHICDDPWKFLSLPTYFLKVFDENFVVVYLDDILVYNNDKNKFRDRLGKMLKILSDNQLYVNPKRFSFLTEQVASEKRSKMDEDKIHTILAWSTSKSFSDDNVCFMDLLLYLSFIKGLNTILSHMAVFNAVFSFWNIGSLRDVDNYT